MSLLFVHAKSTHQPAAFGYINLPLLSEADPASRTVLGQGQEYHISL